MNREKQKKIPRQNQVGKKPFPGWPSNTWRDRWPVLRYVGGFLLLLGIFYAFYITPFFEQQVLLPMVTFQSQVASILLNLFGLETMVEQSLLTGKHASLNIAKGCDGIEATMLFLIGVLLMPFPWGSKLAGILSGTAVLFSLNILRIAGLYLSMAFWPQGFDLLHIHGGFAMFTMVSILLWAGWAGWALRKEKMNSHVEN
jgi:exosortase/archaeosortase family protein